MSLQQLNANSFEEIIYDNGEPCLVIFLEKTATFVKESCQS